MCQISSTSAFKIHPLLSGIQLIISTTQSSSLGLCPLTSPLKTALILACPFFLSSISQMQSFLSNLVPTLAIFTFVKWPNSQSALIVKPIFASLVSVSYSSQSCSLVYFLYTAKRRSGVVSSFQEFNGRMATFFQHFIYDYVS
ncbi:hypothetical protein FGO68_gene4536 [Halteria grandinella]|uniref:Uncharacterized protein n=1 Tax=Halteria grandinella TaxID=5974 RepID=A0A8J8NJK2_HALGN|nr:hypothetical protein FGO68_gene4536 [Halteria grandinella]